MIPKGDFKGRVAPFLLFGVVLLVLPFFVESRSAYGLLNSMGIWLVFALAYNMLLGQTGMLSFGHAVYYGLGGYAAMHAMNAIETAHFGGGGLWASVPVFGLPIIGFAAGLLAGALIGYPSCRRAGVPFAMISLGVGELFAAAAFIFISFFGGEEGITGDRMVGPELFGLSLGPAHEVYWFIAFWTFVATVAIFAFTRTPLGRLANATRDNPERVQFIGYDPMRVRYLVFIASGGFAGMAGAMAAVNFEIFTPLSLGLIPSGVVLLMAYIGGIKYFWGPMVGAVLITFMQSNMSGYSDAWLLYLGVMFIAVVMFAPSGLAGIIDAGLRSTGREGFGRVTVSWLASLVASLISAAGFVVFIELMLRRSGGYGQTFEPLGLVTMRYDDLWPWLVGLALFAAGVALHRVLAPLRERAAGDLERIDAARRAEEQESAA